MDHITHPDDWQALTDAAPLPQHWAYGVVMERLGARVLRLAQNGRPVQILARPGIRLIHRADPALRLGPLARHPGLTLASTLATGAGLIPLITPRTHAVWTIAAPSPQLHAALRPTWRHALNRATARVVADAGAMPQILAQAAAQGRARGYRPLPPEFAQHWPGGVLVLRVGKPLLAGAVFLLHGASASYHAAWSGPRGLEQGAPRALLWQAAQRLAARGITQIDLGAYDAASPGLAHFKLGTGATAVSLGATSLVLPL
ncbi:GNAT family N-acetyltransferase [Pseudotabrizicola sp. L79]|uniref:GNAT family N-acetyltransferase n=1 Tax=Pseudotabrizicola sp. L79 TaxID=3118402 RepID=UPI002F92BD61